ncbi:helix-turn-helix transcriptional regulator [Stackebrandtia nassauensis]|uniref:Transcriptional regulator, LuxR family n=1 Tax=Stackebrandtia nassauensis (strain DSM 44728 / CIP 108903 / NRRL B-16338 / NBRC 102104 / LLR-40K-21) TaxID=446470 RepID=D3PUV9_STANL|nr:AAA family ATPase [Stackebrandtia nassauensis]ADD44983.1 transcriptional regulator, LuxR family [Stackebrandtia nassauensis DSM 44728]
MVANRVVSPAFIGRADALSSLLAAFRSAGAAPGVALIAGEAGIGKSRLVSEFAASLGGGARVVTGGCTQLDDGLAYAPFVAVLRALVRELGAERVAEILPGPGRELARWFPELGAAQSGDKLRLYEEILTLVEAAASKPLVVVIEDLHWADAATAELLGFLARNVNRPGILLVATYRDTEPATGPLLSELRRGGRTTQLRLGPLTRHEVGRQLAAILGDRPEPDVARRIHERSDGNPLFVEALAQSGQSTPDAELLLHVPRTLPDALRRVLRAASVATGEVAHALLATVSGNDEDALDDLVRPLVEGGLLLPTEDGYVFRHDLIRHAVYEDLLPGERKRFHARYAEALRDNGTPSQLATHTYAAGQLGPALDAAWRAATAACDAYAYHEEARMLERILRLWDAVPDAAERLGLDRVAVGTFAAECCMLSGEYARGVDFATEALAIVDEDREPGRAAVLLEHRGRLRDRTDATGIDDLRRAHELLASEPDDNARGRLLGLMAMATYRGDADTALELARDALRIGRETGDPTVTVRGLLVVGGVTSNLDMLTEALSITEELRDHDLEITVLMYLAMHHARQGDHGESARAARGGVDRAQRLGLARSRGTHLAGHLAKALLLSGHWDEAASVVDSALAEGPPPMSRDILRAVAGHLAVLRGDTDTAAELAVDLESGDERLGTHLLHRHVFLCLAALSEGDIDRAEEFLSRALSNPALRRVAPVEVRPVLAVGARIRHARLAAGEQPRHDVAELNAELPVHGRLDKAWHDTIAAMTTGGTAQAWADVVAAWRALDQPYELALSLHIASQVTGNRAQARESAELITALGAAPLVTGDGDTSGLTEREHEVLALIVEGLSNRQIAAKLYISPSTAGVHVSHILAKLGAATRTEAATIAHKRGLVET